MENLQLIGLSQQLAMRRHMEILANNIANMGTTAYKAESVLFEEHLVHTDSLEPDARKLSFVRDLATIRNLTIGSTEPTGGSLDLAITGKGYFAVKTTEGERYTRDGHFKLDAEGRIVTGDGHPLLSADGNEFTLAPTETDITISKDGSLTTSLGPKGQIKIVTFANEGDMLKVGSSLYQTEQKAETATEAKVVQGALERSNVEPLLEITKMMQLLRAYQQVSQLMERSDELQQKAIRTIGQVPQA